LKDADNSNNNNVIFFCVLNLLQFYFYNVTIFFPARPWRDAKSVLHLVYLHFDILIFFIFRQALKDATIFYKIKAAEFKEYSQAKVRFIRKYVANVLLMSSPWP
jgi:hypothetical protein